MQPAREWAARQSKEIKGKTLAFPFISFSESGLFKGLQQIQIKKSAADSARVSGCAQDGFEYVASLLHRPDSNGREFSSAETYTL
jgi:hypothetical protein